MYLLTRVSLQDTQRILQGEIDALRSSIFHIETAAKLEAEKRRYGLVSLLRSSVFPHNMYNII